MSATFRYSLIFFPRFLSAPPKKENHIPSPGAPMLRIHRATPLFEHAPDDQVRRQKRIRISHRPKRHIFRRPRPDAGNTDELLTQLVQRPRGGKPDLS